MVLGSTGEVAMADVGQTGAARSGRLRDAVVRFLAAADGHEAVAAVEEFPELLSNTGVRAVERSVENLRPTFAPEQVKHLAGQVELLRRAQLVGIERALFDRMVQDFMATMDVARRPWPVADR